MWGTLLAIFWAATMIRITPTCVGNTNWHRQEPIPTKDHPHLCGEHGRKMAKQMFPLRITPTCVGNTEKLR